MPRRLVALEDGAFRLDEYEPAPLGAGEVRIRVEFGAPKHGTELHLLQGGFGGKQWDPNLRMFLPREAEEAPPGWPRGMGNMVVGTVIETGPDAARFAVGERVFGYGPLRETHQGPESAWYPLGDLAPEDAVCMDPGHVGFVAVRDGNIRIGDDVAIYGLGAIGLLTVQIARAAGARRVFAVDPLPARRAYAEAHGADRAFDPTDGSDVPLEIKRATEGKGVDVAMDISGNARALHAAGRCIRQCGTVVHVAWGPKQATEVHFNEEWHVNRPTMVFSQAAPYWGNPDRDHPLWDADRAMEAVVDLLRRGKITGKGIVTPIIGFEEAPCLLPDLFAQPDRAIKIGVAL